MYTETSHRACTALASIPAAARMMALAAMLTVVPVRLAATDTPPTPTVITIHFDRSHALQRFKPEEAFGAGVDGLERGDLAHVYTAANIRMMRTAGFKPLAYRLRTELADEAWHWNPSGQWSDPVHKQGYWVSSAAPTGAILTSFGYRLPRRGNTIDQANNDGYSRILDGDDATFWKSNPYLDSHYTRDADSLHRQWVVLDLGRRATLNAIRIDWALPFAVSYNVEFCTGDEPSRIFDSSPNRWRRFAGGTVRNGAGGRETVRLCTEPVTARIVRIMLLTSSHTCPAGSTDIRDRFGFAIREIHLGMLAGDGSLDDVLKHGKTAASQSTVYVSSTDPFHRAGDIDPNLEQPGFDRVYRCGITNGLPVALPVGAIYDTPENAAQMARWLAARKYPVDCIEIGEEPDGQFVLPEDYAALYCQFADALHKVNSKLKLGGPGLQTSVDGYETWEDSSGNASWVNRMFRYLHAHRHLGSLSFFSFEWYPFDNFRRTPHPEVDSAMLKRSMRRFAAEGVPAALPKRMMEYGYSSFSSQAEVELPGALFDAETPALFLSLGGSRCYYYGYEPNELASETEATSSREGWGNLALFLADEDGHIRCPLCSFYASRMLTTRWVTPGRGNHTLYAATSDSRDAAGRELVSAYPLVRPDGMWSILILNKDRTITALPSIRFIDASGAIMPGLSGAISVIQYGEEQYSWQPDGKAGHPVKNNPPVYRQVVNLSQVKLPPYSITIVQGRGPS